MLIRDNAGLLVPRGRITKTLTEPFIPGGSLPSWLEVGAGTASYQTVTSGASPAYARITSGAVSGNAANLRTTFETVASQYDEMVFTLDGLVYGDTDDGYDCYIGFANTPQTAGVGLVHLNAEEPAKVRVHTAGGNVDTDAGYFLKYASGGSRQRRNVTIRWQPKVGMFYVLMDDQVVVAADVSANQVTQAGMRAVSEATTRTAAAKYQQVSQVSLSLTHS